MSIWLYAYAEAWHRRSGPYTASQTRSEPLRALWAWYRRYRRQQRQAARYAVPSTPRPAPQPYQPDIPYLPRHLRHGWQELPGQGRLNPELQRRRVYLKDGLISRRLKRKLPT